MSILITGGSGRLGKELKYVFPKAFTPTHAEMDIRNEKDVRSILNTKKPLTVIHAAALVDRRKCDEDRELAWRTNVVGTENIVNMINKCIPLTRLIYVSTACVFDGETGMYSETSLPCPKDFYGLTKLLGEFITGRVNDYTVARTNFVPREPWKYKKAFTDRYGTYLYARDVAFAIKDLLGSDLKGTIHIAGDEKISMFDLAKQLSPDVKPRTLKGYKGPPLTKDMSLTSERWKKYKLGFSYDT